MTITEHLEFSVLTAPIASLDRRALSQAWYSALYGSAKSTAHTALAPQQTIAPVRETHACFAAPQTQGPPHRGVRPERLHTGWNAVRGAEPERRSPRSALARKIERTFLHPQSAVRKASFQIEGLQGRVRILLQTRGAQLRLIAICSPKAKPQVAVALAQARYALAARGIAVDMEMRGEAPC